MLSNRLSILFLRHQNLIIVAAAACLVGTQFVKFSSSPPPPITSSSSLSEESLRGVVRQQQHHDIMINNEGVALEPNKNNDAASLQNRLEHEQQQPPNMQNNVPLMEAETLLQNNHLALHDEKTAEESNNNNIKGEEENKNNNNKPNILLMVLDQWRYDWDGFHTSPTPNNQEPIPLNVPFLKWLAQHGTRFTQAYVPSPLCAPCRACLASGLDYDETGLFENDQDLFPPNRITTYKLLRDEGKYHTMTCGKDDLYRGDQRFPLYRDYNYGADRMDLGFVDAIRSTGKASVVLNEKHHEAYRDFLESHTVPYPQSDGSMVDVSSMDVYKSCINRARVGYHDEGELKDKELCNSISFDESIYPDVFVKDMAIELLHRRPPPIHDQPWFLQVNFPGPHGPFMSTAPMAESVKNRMWPPPFHTKKDINKQTTVCPQQQQQQQQPEPQFSGRCNYGAQIELIDNLMSTIVDQGIRQTHQQEDNNEPILSNTIICAIGDHGEMLGDFNLSDKKKPWQASISVPMICAGYNIQKNHVFDKPVTLLDLFGTFMDYAGVPVPDYMSTKSLRSVLEGGNNRNMQPPPPIRSHVTSGLKNWRLVVKEINGSIYKLICCQGGGARSNNFCGIDGPPTAIPRVENTKNDNGEIIQWSHLLYDVVADPFEMNPIQNVRQDLVMQLRPLLPMGWCPTGDVIS